MSSEFGVTYPRQNRNHMTELQELTSTTIYNDSEGKLYLFFTKWSKSPFLKLLFAGFFLNNNGWLRIILLKKTKSGVDHIKLFFLRFFLWC